MVTGAHSTETLDNHKNRIKDTLSSTILLMPKMSNNSHHSITMVVHTATVVTRDISIHTATQGDHTGHFYTYSTQSGGLAATSSCQISMMMPCGCHDHAIPEKSTVFRGVVVLSQVYDITAVLFYPSVICLSTLHMACWQMHVNTFLNKCFTLFKCHLSEPHVLGSHSNVLRYSCKCIRVYLICFYITLVFI